MRFWPFARALPRGHDVTDDLAITEDLLRRNVDDVLAVRERQVHGPIIVFRGDLLVEADRAMDLLLQRFGRFGYTPFLRSDNGSVVVQAWPAVQTLRRQRVALNVALFLLTCVSTLVAGAFYVGSPTFDAFRSPALPWPLQFLSGVPFAGALLAILVTHEFGHYFTARHYGASVSLPYFIPAPPLFGTFGAIIRMRSPARDRNSLFDIAAAGPLAGLVVAVVAMLLGLEWSRLGPARPEYLHFGDSLLRHFFVYLTFGSIPAGMMVYTHPIADAAWAGFLVTALNLFPVGQLDGGRIAYALFGSRHRLVGKLTFVTLLLMAAVTRSPNWVVWAALIFFLVGFGHSPPVDDVSPLSPGRRAIGLLCFLLLVLLIPPVPIPIE
jgi:membrane-associated protease RseP (regulator of RpoE activity)